MKVLIVKTSSLGDIIHAFPVLHFLKQEFLDVKIDWVVEKSFSEIVKAHPLVDQVIEMDTKGWRKGFFKYATWKEIFHFRKNLQQTHYDVVIDLQGNTKSAVPTFFARCTHKVGFGLKTIHEWPNTWVTHHRFNPPLYLNVRDENLSLVQNYFQRYSKVEDEKVVLKLNSNQHIIFNEIKSKVHQFPGKKILVCPGSAWKNKQLSKETLQEFLLKLRNHLKAHLIIAWGTSAEYALACELKEALKEEISLLEKLPLPVLQNLMNEMDYVIAMDSLPLHLAGTTGTPTFSVFGASSAQKYKPLGSIHHAVQGACPYKQIFERRCSRLRTCPTGLCIQGLSGDFLFQEFCKQNN